MKKFVAFAVAALFLAGCGTKSSPEAKQGAKEKEKALQLQTLTTLARLYKNTKVACISGSEYFIRLEQGATELPAGWYRMGKDLSFYKLENGTLYMPTPNIHTLTSVSAIDTRGLTCYTAESSPA